MKTKGWQELEALVESWGGSMRRLKREDGRLDCPFAPGSLGTSWEDKTIFYSTKDVVGAIHEAGHVFADATKASYEDEDSEYDFLGWEFAMIKELGLTLEDWLRESGDYIVAGPSNYIAAGQLPPEHFLIVVEERIKKATDLGLIVDGRPVSLR